MKNYLLILLTFFSNSSFLLSIALAGVLMIGCAAQEEVVKLNQQIDDISAQSQGGNDSSKFQLEAPATATAPATAAPATAAPPPEWTLIYESSDSKSKYYANILKINANKKFSKLRLWTIEDFKLLQEVASYKYLSVKSFTEFDCKNSKLRIMGYSLYEDNMAKGKIIFSKGTPFEWQKINKDTMNEKYLDIACRESGLS